MSLHTVKFSNGNILTIEDEAGYRLFKITKLNKPKTWIEKGCYKFAKKLKTVKKKLEILLGSNTLIFYKVLR